MIVLTADRSLKLRFRERIVPVNHQTNWIRARNAAHTQGGLPPLRTLYKHFSNPEYRSTFSSYEIKIVDEVAPFWAREVLAWSGTRTYSFFERGKQHDVLSGRFALRLDDLLDHIPAEELPLLSQSHTALLIDPLPGRFPSYGPTDKKRKLISPSSIFVSGGVPDIANVDPKTGFFSKNASGSLYSFGFDVYPFIGGIWHSGTARHRYPTLPDLSGLVSLPWINLNRQRVSYVVYDLLQPDNRLVVGGISSPEVRKFALDPTCIPDKMLGLNLPPILLKDLSENARELEF
ncbi:hypothetical protein HY988_06610 [Candidatus Micrarchaeota archaeon]|nr:hypothetical protein [Candidatus Micrarchaeota archaeon]